MRKIFGGVFKSPMVSPFRDLSRSIGEIIIAPASWAVSATEIIQFAAAPTSPAPQPLTAADFY